MKDIPRFEGKYAVTSCGKVWSYKHKKFLKPQTVKGYSRVVLVDKDNKVHQCNIHRLVAMTYIPNPDNLPCVNHKDEKRTNNCVDNLEWCTYQHNNTYGGRIEKVRAKVVGKGYWKNGVETIKRRFSAWKLAWFMRVQWRLPDSLASAIVTSAVVAMVSVRPRAATIGNLRR